MTAASRREGVHQEQFLEVVDRDEAKRRFHAHLSLAPLGGENLSLAAALNRVLGQDVPAEVDVPGFDRSNVDGFAVRSADLTGAFEERPRELQLNDEVLSPGVLPAISVAAGTATPIATGGIVPRGADAVVMIEDTEYVDSALRISRVVAAGENVTFAGTDIARGETVLRAGALITSREIGVLAAIGRTGVEVVRRPRVAVVSTGNEIVPPGAPLPVGAVYDSNLFILSAAIEELGCEAVPLGVVSDDEERLRAIVATALDCDAVVLSGGTSKGAGDLSYRVVREFDDPGIVAHGVALKPGKPICLAVTRGKPVVVLPGFPTSAIFTFHEFVAPVLRALAGRPNESRPTVQARPAMRINSARGRTEYVLVGLVERGLGTEPEPRAIDPPGNSDSESLPISAHPSDRGADQSAGSLVAYPMGKGSGSVTTFSAADGFFTIDQNTEYVDTDRVQTVTLLGPGIRPADLVVIGSHCTGLDLLLTHLVRRGFTAKVLHVGSTGGLNAAKRGECDLAGLHLLDPESGEYNHPLFPPDVEFVPGYRRQQCLVHRSDDARFAGRTLDDAIRTALADPGCVMINRNPGSGTRVLIDELLAGRRPPGYLVPSKSHNAVATAITQGRADWGVAIANVATTYGLAAIPIRAEHYDFAVPRSRLNRPAVVAFRALLDDEVIRETLGEMGFDPRTTGPARETKSS